MMVHFILAGGVVLNVTHVVAVEVDAEMGICTVRTTATPAVGKPGSYAYTFRGAAAKQVAEFFTGMAQDLAAEQLEK